MSMSMLNIMHPHPHPEVALHWLQHGVLTRNKERETAELAELYSAQALCAVRTGVSALTTESASTNTSTLAKHLFTSVEINQSLLKKENIFRRSREPVLFVCLLETDH